MATLSKGGQTWSTKLERIRVLSKERPSEVFNNLGHIIDEHFLLECFRQLDGKKAVGIDKVTKEIHAGDLASNITELLIRIRRGTYEPQAARIVEIPKADGSKRPLAIACFEDKIVQMAMAKILEAIYEPLFLPSSYGFRPGRNTHDALTQLMQVMYDNPNGAIVEIDIRKYFNSVPHGPLKDMLGGKISDRRFLGLLHKLMTAGTINSDGRTEANHIGVPQGSILSPILSNIYLHYVTDCWAEELKTHFHGGIELVRYADDLVFLFKKMQDAQVFNRALPKRMAKYGLEIAAEKSSLLPSGRWAIQSLLKAGKAMPKFRFLGFEVMWIKNRHGNYRPRVKPRGDRMNQRLDAIKTYLRQNRNHPNHVVVLRQVRRVTDGWMQHFSVSDCGKYVWAFTHRVRIMLYRWFNRRGKTGCMNWEKLNQILVAHGLKQSKPLHRLYHSAPTTGKPT